MPRIRTNSSTPESRRRELLVKSSINNPKVELISQPVKSTAQNTTNYEKNQKLSHEEQSTSYNNHAVINFIKCTNRRDSSLVLTNDDIQMFENISTTNKKSHDSNSISSAIHRAHRTSTNITSNGNGQPYFISCLNIKPNYKFFETNDQYHRRRTSSLPSSTIIVDLSMPVKMNNHRCSSLVNFPLWHNNPHKIIYLYNRKYHCQPISNFDQNQILLADSTHIDIYNILTGKCEEKLCFQSSNINYIAVCYNTYKNELLVASISDLYIYNLAECKVSYEIRLPGFPFSLDHSNQIRYLVCNSSSIYHGYFSFTSACTSTVLSRLSQFGFKHVCDLEFDDGTMHGLHAFEGYVGVVIRYGRYSSKNEDYCLYIYDSSLDNEYYHIDLNDIGSITCLTGYERTLDWILCDYEKQRIIFVNEESVEYVQYNEKLNQCVILNETNHFVVWLSNRIFIYNIE